MSKTECQITCSKSMEMYANMECRITYSRRVLASRILFSSRKLLIATTNGHYLYAYLLNLQDDRIYNCCYHQG